MNIMGSNQNKEISESSGNSIKEHSCNGENLGESISICENGSINDIPSDDALAKRRKQRRASDCLEFTLEVHPCLKKEEI